MTSPDLLAEEPPRAEKPAAPHDYAAQMQYALRQFLFIADQRIKTFNFYVVVLAASSATTMKLATEFRRREFLFVGCFHLVVVAVFWMIEQRNLRLLRIAKKALIRLEEEQRWPAWARLAAADHKLRHWVSYRGAILTAFCAQFLVGVLLLVCATIDHHKPAETPTVRLDPSPAQEPRADESMPAP